MANIKTQNRIRRHARVRKVVEGSADRPRLSVYKSNRAIYAQLVDDEKGVTLGAATSKDLKGKTPTDRAKAAGLLIAEAAKAKKISKVVFDRGGFVYTGQIKVFADAAREGGLIF